jgi:trimeric autotransporter adhesin
MRERSQSGGVDAGQRIRRALLAMGAALVALLALQVASAGAVVGLGGAPTPTWVTNGPVDALARSGNILYLGGNFSEVGPRTGPAVALNAATGAVAAPAPQLAGRGVEIDATLPDGSGGYYAAGNFHYLAATPGAGPTPHAFLVHILAGGSLDPSFAPTVNGKVLALVRSGSTLYAGGDFTNVDGQKAHFLVALNAASGALNTSFTPNPDNAVTALAFSGPNLIAAGAFSQLGGDAADKFIGEVNPSTGAALGAFNAGANGPVNALAPSGDGSHVYVGGSFTAIGGQSFSNLAELDAGSGAAVAAFNPNPDNAVYALALSGSQLYAGGAFVGFQNDTVTEPYLAALDPGTGAVDTAFAPAPQGDVFALLLSGDGQTLYAGGQFVGIGGGNANYLAALNASTGALVSSFNPALNNTVFALSSDGTNLYAGGAFTSAGAQAQADIAAIDLSTGAEVPAFQTASSVTSTVNALTLSPDGKTLYLAGTGSSEPAEAISTATGATVSTFAPNTSLGPANALVVSADGNTLYAAGGIAGFSGYVVALSTADGSVAAGWPSTSGGASADGVALNDAGNALVLDAADSKLFVGGDFSQVGSAGHGAVAALSTADGSLIAGFDPAPGPVTDPVSGITTPPTVHALALSPDRSTLYVGGLFAGLGGSSTPSNLGAVNPASGVFAGFAGQPGGAVNAIAPTPDNSTVYVGGAFASVGDGSPPSYLAEFDPSANLAPFAPGMDDTVLALLASADSQQLVVGGNFRGSLGAPQEGVALFNPGPPLPPEPKASPPPPVIPVVSFASVGKAQLKRSGKKVLLQTGKSANCQAPTVCSVTVIVTARVTTFTKVKIKGKKTKKGKPRFKLRKHTRTKSILQQTISVAAGQKQTLVITLSSREAATLTAKTTGHVTESLSARVSGGTPVVASGKISTKLPALHKKKHKKKPKKHKPKKHKKKK